METLGKKIWIIYRKSEAFLYSFHFHHIQLTSQILKSYCAFLCVFLLEIETLYHYSEKTEKKIDASSSIYEYLRA